MGRLIVTVAALFLAVLPVVASGHGSAPYRMDVQVGPYPVVVEFSEWPIQAERSLDILIEPAGGIADKSGTIRLIPPSHEEVVVEPGAMSDEPAAWTLVRHPRFRDVWGLDLIALPAAGNWNFELTIDGAAGVGTATVGPITLLARPGPSATIAWAVGVLPIFFLIWLIARGWRSARPGRSAEAVAWAA